MLGGSTGGGGGGRSSSPNAQSLTLSKRPPSSLLASHSRAYSRRSCSSRANRANSSSPSAASRSEPAMRSASPTHTSTRPSNSIANRPRHSSRAGPSIALRSAIWPSNTPAVDRSSAANAVASAQPNRTSSLIAPSSPIPRPSLERENWSSGRARPSASQVSAPNDRHHGV